MTGIISFCNYWLSSDLLQSYCYLFYVFWVFLKVDISGRWWEYCPLFQSRLWSYLDDRHSGFDEVEKFQKQNAKRFRDTRYNFQVTLVLVKLVDLGLFGSPDFYTIADSDYRHVYSQIWIGNLATGLVRWINSLLTKNLGFYMKN